MFGRKRERPVREPRTREPRGAADAYREPASRADSDYRRQVEDDRLRTERLRDEERVRRSYER